MAPPVAGVSAASPSSRGGGGPMASLAGALGLPDGAMEDAHRTVEKLFEKTPLEEIRGIEKRARAQVDLKREELRQVIGESCGDFIDSADSVKAMSQSCTAIVESLGVIGRSIRALGDVLDDRLKPASKERSATEGTSSQSLVTNLYALGSRAKVLLDTPEAIWAVLEVEKMSQQKSHGVDAVPGESDASSRVISHGARLAARAVVLWRTQGKEVSARFPLLAHQKPQLYDLCSKLRQACLLRLEAAHLDRALAADALAAIALLDVIHSFEDGGGSVKERQNLCSLWLSQRLKAIAGAVTSWQTLSLASQIVKNVVTEAETLFVSSKRSESVASKSVSDVEGDIWYEALPNHEKELTLWRGCVDQFVDHIASLPPENVSDLCCKWFKDAQSESSKLIEEFVGQIADMPGLVEAEQKTYDEISRDLNDNAQRSGSSVPALRFGDSCLSLLKHNVHLWRDFYELSFLERAKSIFKRELFQIIPKIEDHIAYSHPNASQNVPVKGSRSYRDRLRLVLETITGESKRLFVQIIEFMLVPCDAVVLENRIRELQGFIQECFYGFLGEVMDLLDRSMSDSGIDDGNCEYGVFLSNLCDCLQVENSHLLSLLLGKPKEWIELTVSHKEDISATDVYSMSTSDLHAERSRILSRIQQKSLSSSQMVLSALPFPHLGALRERLQTVSLKAFTVFVDRICMHIEKGLADDLTGDKNLCSSKLQAHWEEIVVKHEGEGAEGDDSIEMKFLLPLEPSPYLVGRLFYAIRELHEARYLKLNVPNLKALEHELSLTFSRAFINFLDQSEKSKQRVVSEKGALQMLFDVRFVFDVLAGGSTKTSHPSKVLYTARKSSSAQLEERLSSMLDPIDWATYEPYLWNHKSQFYHRSQLLFHDFISTQRMDGGKDVKMKTSAKSNIMEISSGIPRYSFLPISTPSPLKAETAEDIFHLLSGSLPDSQRGSPADRKHDPASEGANKSGIFGGLLGERAAEATAMAQDLFSGSGFSSFLSNKAKQ